MILISKAALAALVIVAGGVAAGSASAAKPSGGHVSPDGADPVCVFEADLGRYVCANPKLPAVASLSGDQDSVSGKGKVSIQMIPADPHVALPKFP